MPAAKLRPVAPSTTARPPVMYSQPWSPTPSTTAEAPELRTEKRSPAIPGKDARRDAAPHARGEKGGPDGGPDRAGLPTTTVSAALNSASSGGRTVGTPPGRPLPV